MSVGDALRDRCAIVGIGETALGRLPRRTALDLAQEAALAALSDAGLAPGDVDGIVSQSRGRVWSVAVAHQVYHPDLEAQVPYAVAVVELEEGVRMVSNVVGVLPGAIEVGMPVEVVFEEAWGVTVPRFRSRGGA